jgi:hypothetical protein
MENNRFWYLPVFILCLSAFFNPVDAQLFENSFAGVPSIGETAQDSKVLPDNRYATLSNTRQYAHPNGSQIMLTILDNNGSVALNVAIKEQVSYINEYFGAALEPDLSATGQLTGFFIAGHRKVGQREQAILIRTDEKGVVTWTKVLPNNVGGLDLDGRAVSVERQANGDVIVTGAHPRQSTYHQPYFFAARFNSNGALLWSNRYHSDAPGYSFEATEACNGLRSGVSVIAVTGRMWTNGEQFHRTFLSCIDAATGTEIWRRSYASTASQDGGADVVYKPASANEPAAFMVVGASGVQHPLLWVVRANPLNGLGNGRVYAPAIPNSLTYGFAGTAVSLDVTGTKAAITGPLYFAPLKGDFQNGTYALVLPFYGTEMPDWARFYHSSTPHSIAQHSISYVKGASPGYLIGCGVESPFASQGAVHAIRTNATGGVGLKGCDVLSFEVNRTPGGEQVWRPFRQVLTAWTSIPLMQFDRAFREQFCDDGVLIPRMAQTNQSGSVVAGEVRIMPNPSDAGGVVEVALRTEQAGRMRLRLLDLTGREIWSQEQEVDSGETRMALPTELLQKGVYLLHCTAPGVDRVEKIARL